MRSGERLVCDVCVVGAGLVGASFALACAGTGLRVGVADAVPPVPPVPPVNAWDARIYTLSPGSQAFLEDLGVWADLPPERLQPVHRMRVFGDRGAELQFSDYESGLSRLATTVEAGRLQHVLWRRMASVPQLTLLAGARPEALSGPDGRCRALRLRTQDDAVIDVSARLVVGADGARSWVREAAGIAPRASSFGQVGVVANLRADRPHSGTAYQWFRPDGILAWLPLPEDQISIVWSTDAEHAEQLRQLASEVPKAFAARVAEAGGHGLGGMRLTGPVRVFPLEGLSVASPIADRIALIGDAAHVVHPLAGQGVNLGFGDAEALADVVGRAGGGDPGERGRLRRFERARAEAILAMRLTTDGLHRLFRSSDPAIGALRNLGLNLADRLTVLKTLLVRGATAG